MQIVVVGAHQRTAPMIIRERLAFTAAELPAALQKLAEHTHEAFILSTCNRVEVYAVCAQGDGGRVLRQFLAEHHAISLEELTPYVYTLSGEDAVRHLFRVAAGLDSMALGEDQIMVQIKSSLEAATEAQTLGPLLHRLVTTALTAGKQVRTRTELSRAQLSVVSVALQLGRVQLGSFAGKRMALLGSGRTAELTLKHLRKEAPQVIISGRTAGNVTALAQRYDAQASRLDDLATLLAEVDVLVCCTSSPEPLVTRAMLEQVIPQRTTPLVILDLAVPRDVEREAGALAGVTLIDVDDMQSVCDTNRAARAAEVSSAENIVDQQLQKFMHWWATREVLPTIRALRSHAEAIRQSEVERALNRLSSLSDADQQAVQALTVAIVNKLLHDPITTLKEPQAGEELAQATQQLFRLHT